MQDVSYDLHAENRPDNIMTEYERKFSGFGEKINRCEVIFEASSASEASSENEAKEDEPVESKDEKKED